MIDSSRVVKKLRTYQKKSKLSQEKLSKKLDVSFTTVNRWFNGKNLPKGARLRRIEKLLKGTGL
jgi:transcriptional regulator with XRE-family HTH domain